MVFMARKKINHPTNKEAEKNYTDNGIELGEVPWIISTSTIATST